MDIEIRPSRLSDIGEYSRLLQRVYTAAYVDLSLGLTPDCFSERVFETENTQAYLIGNLVNSEVQKTWLAIVEKKMVGTITVTDKGDECELRGFYVDVSMQHRGIGKRLFEEALQFAGSKDMVLDTYAHNKTIGVYEKWGFVVDSAKGEFYRHWPEWPDGLKAKCIYMRLRGKDRQWVNHHGK